MKTARKIVDSILLFALLVQGSAFALSPYYNAKGLSDPKSCVDSGDWYIVVKKLYSAKGKTCYEMTGLTWVSPHAIACTKTKLHHTGASHMLIHYKGTANMEMESGFSEPVDLWTDCSAKAKSGEKK